VLDRVDERIFRDLAARVLRRERGLEHIGGQVEELEPGGAADAEAYQRLVSVASIDTPVVVAVPPENEIVPLPSSTSGLVTLESMPTPSWM